MAQKLISSGTIYHDDPDCFWTDTYYAIPEEIENLFSNMKLDTIDHLAPDGISLFLKQQVDGMDEKEFKIWCDYHYMVCREKNIRYEQSWINYWQKIRNLRICKVIDYLIMVI